MYQPKYTITNKILHDVGLVDACREVITNAPLVPSWEAKFREEAIIRTVHYGTHLEGNELNYTEAAKVLAGGQIVGRERDIQEVINYRNVLKYIEECGSEVKEGAEGQEGKDGSEGKNYYIITEEKIKKIHKLTTEKILTPEQCGFYRATQVVIRNSVTGEITFRPPPSVEVPYLMEDFVKWYTQPEAGEMHPIIKAGITHYEIVRIHPFVDGNGRVARATATLVLFSQGYDIKRFFSLEEHYDNDAATYYNALSTATNTGDLTKWLEYFTEGLAIELTRIKEKVQKISTDLKIRKKRGQIALNERQLKILEYIQAVGFMNNKAFKELFPMVSEDTILRDLNQLAKMKILRKEGSTKKARYVIKS